MQFIISLVDSKPYLNQPDGWWGWVGFILLIIGSLWLCVSIRKIIFQLNRKRIWLFFVLFLLQPLFSLFLGYRLSTTGFAFNLPIMLVAAIPWMIAAGLIGPIPSLLLAVSNSIFICLWGSHDLFGITSAVISALIFNWAIRQNYEGKLLRILRHPVMAWLLVLAANLPVLFIIGWFDSGTIISYGSANAFGGVTAANLHFMLGTGLAVVVCEILFAAAREEWVHPKTLVTIKSIHSSQSKYLLTAGVICIIILISLSALIWNVSVGNELNNIKSKMESSAEIISSNVPYLIQTGQSILMDNSGKELFTGTVENRKAALQEMLRAVPYFSQIYILDSSMQILERYPGESTRDLTPEDLARLHYVENGQGAQTYIVQTSKTEAQSVLSFIVPFRGDGGELLGVILGRTDLRTNPFSQSIVEELNSAGKYQAVSALIDEYKRIIISNSSGISSDQFDLIDTEGFQVNTRTNNFQLVTAVRGSTWKVLFTLPYSEINRKVFNGIWPSLLMIVLIVLLGYLGFYLYLSRLLKELSAVTNAIEKPESEDLLIEKAAMAFSEMQVLRSKLASKREETQNQIEDKGQLLKISQSIPSFGSYDEAIQPYLELILKKGADSARLIITDAEICGGYKSEPIIIKNGATADLFSYLDLQIIDLIKNQNRVILPFAYRSTQLNLLPGHLHPGAIIAFTVVHEDRKLGIVWAAFDQPRNFNKTDLQFYDDIIAEIQNKIMLFQQYRKIEETSEILNEAVNKIPFPILFASKENKLVLANQAASDLPEVIDNKKKTGNGEKEIIFKSLVDILGQKEYNNQEPSEILFPDKHSYIVRIYPVASESTGTRLVILQDSSAEKERSQKQNDFIETVSHDMRSPLTLVKGYLNMLEMVGPLNEQQKDFIQKIIINVDSMTKLVNNILDIERLESGIGLKKEITSPDEILDETIEDLKPSAAQKNIQIDCVKETKVKCLVDRFLLKQAIYNLIENSIKYSAVGDKIEIRLLEKDHNIEFIVKDHGAGIAPIDLPRIFDKEYRSNLKNQDQIRGAGLGLSIVKSIAERHNGKVWVESQLGKGSTFYLEIPVVESDQ